MGHAGRDARHSLTYRMIVHLTDQLSAKLCDNAIGWAARRPIDDQTQSLNDMEAGRMATDVL